LHEEVKNQHTLMEELKSEINSCCANVTKDNLNVEKIFSESKLFQNNPNPFTSIMEIKYHIESSFQGAFINIYNPNGEQIKSYQIQVDGLGSITISSSNLRAVCIFII
jgi:hypothetical protein